MNKQQLVTLTAAGLALLPATRALAGDFDQAGRFVPDPTSVAFERGLNPISYFQEGSSEECLFPHFDLIADAADALEGSEYIKVDSFGSCLERIVLFGDDVLVPEAPPAPDQAASYTASLWMRHGSASARLVVRYAEEDVVIGVLAPTGRATSDGWVELASNPVPIDGARKPLVYVRFIDFAAEDGVDLDAIELVESGPFRDQPTCTGYADPVCGEDAVCISGRCKLGGPSVPPLPRDEIRSEMVASLKSKLHTFFGGQSTRQNNLPLALATVESLMEAQTGWQFWNGWATAIHQLGDWHTNINSAFQETEPGAGLNVCFIEGSADRSQTIAPKHPVFPDVMVSHTGTGSIAGLAAGDRLVAIDGLHPIEWARGLSGVNWSHHPPCDPQSYSDYVEDLGRSRGLISRYATNFTVVRCDQTSGQCNGELETIAVAELPPVSGQGVACDNRPSYHLGVNSPAEDHRVGFDFFEGRIDGTSEEEAIFGMLWDTLYGGGDPNGYVNGKIRNAVTRWKNEARGVILDHRAGNGGTLDAPQYMTELVRPTETWAVALMPIHKAAWDGPASASEGIALFNSFASSSPYVVGSEQYDAALPVALITHRDGSASDYLPQGMKGAPKTRIFGPGPTAGAFSTFIQFVYWGDVSFQFASGDTISKDGAALIGHGVIPDEIVEQKQSDLLAGKDSIHEAALAWVRQELKP